MPLYEMNCPKCCEEHEIHEVTMKLDEHEKICKGKKKAPCPNCKANMRFYLSPVRFKI